jgi:nicotianamine synthase
MKENGSYTKHQILALYRHLRTLPSDVLDQGGSDSFEDLLRLVMATESRTAQEILSDIEIRRVQPHLRDLWANFEYWREKRWALRICNSLQLSAELETYPDFGFYDKLVAFEYALSQALCEGKVRHALFVGCGPLPLTSILLAQKAGLHVDCLDKKREACDIAMKVIKRLGLTGLLRFDHAEVDAMTDIAKYNVIIIATLAGETDQEKIGIIRFLRDHMKKDQILILRTVHELWALLYRETRLSYLDGFQIHFANRSSPVIRAVIVAETLP